MINEQENISFEPDKLTREDYELLVEGLLHLPGLDYIEGVQTLMAGLPNEVRCRLPVSISQEKYGGRRSFVLTNFLRYAATYPQGYGWPKSWGDTPLMVILKNLLFHARMDGQPAVIQPIEKILNRLSKPDERTKA